MYALFDVGYWIRIQQHSIVRLPELLEQSCVLYIAAAVGRNNRIQIPLVKQPARKLPDVTPKSTQLQYPLYYLIESLTTTVERLFSLLSTTDIGTGGSRRSHRQYEKTAVQNDDAHCRHSTVSAM